MGFPKIHLLLAVFALLLTSLGSVNAQSSVSQKDLQLPPGDGPLEVLTSFHLLTVHQIDDEAESFKFSGILTLQWMDSRQAFDPEIEGIPEKQYHGDFQFNELAPSWYPQVVLANSIDLADSQGVLLRVQPDGTSTLTQTVTAEARAHLNLRSYPFDRQQLEVIFCILGYHETEVVLTPSNSGISVNFSRIQIPQWNLLDVKASPASVLAPFSNNGEKSSLLIVSLDTQRQSFFMMRLVIFPLVLIVILSWSVFWMDRSSLGDRMSVSFVGILTAVAYQIMVSDIMPHISYVTFVNALISFSLLVMCATVFVNLRVGALEKKGEIERSERVDRRCRWMFPLAYSTLVVIAVVYTCLGSA